MTASIANTPPRPVLIMGGGTGGHIFPGIAVGAELRQRGVPVVWLGGPGRLEQRLVPEAGFPLETLDFSGVRGKGVLTLLRAPWRLLRAVLAARGLLSRLQPRSVLSMGGYAAAPGGLAARTLGIPLIVHEQNSVAGFTNRLLARFASRVLAGFQNVFSNAEWTGNPVRAEIAALPAPVVRMAGRSGALRILVLGGSQGARQLNGALPAVLQASGLPVQVRHQCGADHLEATRENYAASGVAAEIEPFISDMVAAYAWADLIICRAGALTLAELCAAGVGSVLVPFPHAVDDHQTRNAQALVSAGAAMLVAEGADFSVRLTATLAQLGGRDHLQAMASAARQLARPNAAQRIADICLEVAA